MLYGTLQRLQRATNVATNAHVHMDMQPGTAEALAAHTTRAAWHGAYTLEKPPCPIS